LPRLSLREIGLPIRRAASHIDFSRDVPLPHTRAKQKTTGMRTT
jgi:hypothetical protein